MKNKRSTSTAGSVILVFLLFGAFGIVVPAAFAVTTHYNSDGSVDPGVTAKDAAKDTAKDVAKDSAKNVSKDIGKDTGHSSSCSQPPQPCVGPPCRGGH